MTSPALRPVADLQYVAADGTPLHRVASRYYPISEGELTPEAFGAPPYGDATAALQEMFSEIQDGDVVRFRRLHDITAPLYTAANNVTFVTELPYSRAGVRCTTAGVQMITFGGYGVTWDGPMLVGDGTPGGDGSGSTVLGITFIRADGSKDVDSTVLGGNFYLLRECIRVRGCNLRVQNSMFSTGYRGIIIDQNGSDECRGHIIRSNRFHSFGGLGSASKGIVMSAAAFGCEVKDNYADAIYTLYEGPVNNTEIDGNKLFKAVAEGITIVNAQNDGGWQLNGSVSRNTVYKNAPGYLLTSGISVRQLRNGRVCQNVVVGPRAHGIALYDCTSNVVTDNNITQPGYLGSADPGAWGIYGDAQSIGNVLTGNVVRSAGVTSSTGGGISVAADNHVEINRVDSAYGARRYVGCSPTLGVL